MDELQVKHAFDQIEFYQAQLKSELLDPNGETVAELEERIEELEEDLTTETEKREDAEDDLKEYIKSLEKIRDLLDDNGTDENDKIQAIQAEIDSIL